MNAASAVGDLPLMGRRPRCRSAGFSLVELMIALVLGMLLAEGIFVLFSQTHRISNTQIGLARLQENARFASTAITESLRSARTLHCGSTAPPEVSVDSLGAHVWGAPAAAAAPPNWPTTLPYPVDGALFLRGSSCSAAQCVPALESGLGLPPLGSASGDRVPGTDVMTLRFLPEVAWSVAPATSGPVCTSSGELGALSLMRPPPGAAPGSFDPSHLALLATCSGSQVFQPRINGNEIRPVPGSRGVPKCVTIDAQTRLFDVDSQMQTVTYYVVEKSRDVDAGETVAILMRRVNGASEELVEGVERFDLHYSLTDSRGISHWLTAAEVERSAGADGSSLLCRTASVACTWADVSAVEVAMLVNTVDNVPADGAQHDLDYRYSIDGEQMFSPAPTMPVTGLPAGRVLRREFRFVVALAGAQI